MFCPECQAEYRHGFTRCADCNVELVSTEMDAVRQRHVEIAAETGAYDLLLWKGTDTGFYLSLLGALDGFGIERMGRATSPPIHMEFSHGLEESFEPEFGIWISKRDSFLGRWVLNSELESEAEDDALMESLSASKGREPESDPKEDAERTGYVCVLCFAQYSEAIGDCPNCGISLRPAQEVSVFDNAVRSLSNLDHPDFANALRSELKRAGIRFNKSNLVSGNVITGTRRYIPGYHVVVLEPDYDRARRIFANLLRYWQFDKGLVSMSRHDPTKAYWPDRAEENRWLPEDLTAEAWSGTNLYKLSGIGQALHEFEIPYSVLVEEPGKAKVLVHPEDVERALGLVQEALEGQTESFG